MERSEAVVVEASAPVRQSLPAPPMWIFALLAIPSAVMSNGFVSTAAASLLRSEGMPLKDIPNVLQLLQLPPILYFLWSPLVDFWVRRRTWMALSSAAGGLVLATALQSKRLGETLPMTLVFLAVATVTLQSAALGGLMAAVVPAEKKSRASGLYQAGNIGFGALSGGFILFLSAHLARHEFGIACGVLVALPGLLGLVVAEPAVVAKDEAFGSALRLMGREFKHTFLKWQALPVLLMLVSPMGSGAALGLFSGMAPDYRISVEQVAWINGALGGLLNAFGALLIGFMKLPKDMRPVYCIAGLVNALTLGILMLGHPRPFTYLLSVTLYMISVGVCYALFTALVFQLLGVAGKSGGARYAIALSLGNAPIWYMTIVDGLGARWFGVKGLPGIDMTVTGLVAIVALAWLWSERRKGIGAVQGLVAEEA